MAQQWRQVDKGVPTWERPYLLCFFFFLLAGHRRSSPQLYAAHKLKWRTAVRSIRVRHHLADGPCASAKAAQQKTSQGGEGGSWFSPQSSIRELNTFPCRPKCHFHLGFRVQLKFMVTSCLRHTDAHLIEADCCAIERYLQQVCDSCPSTTHSGILQIRCSSRMIGGWIWMARNRLGLDLGKGKPLALAGAKQHLVPVLLCCCVYHQWRDRVHGPAQLRGLRPAESESRPSAGNAQPELSGRLLFPLPPNSYWMLNHVPFVGFEITFCRSRARGRNAGYLLAVGLSCPHDPPTTCTWPIHCSRMLVAMNTKSDDANQPLQFLLAKAATTPSAIYYRNGISIHLFQPKSAQSTLNYF